MNRFFPDWLVSPGWPVSLFPFPVADDADRGYSSLMTTRPSKEIKTFENPNPDRNYVIEFDCPEFTCLCPMTGQPDFAEFEIRYVPDKLCVELKSLKLYMWSYRDEGAFHEAVTNRILTDLVDAVRPRWMEVRGYFNVRGGIATTVVVSHGNPL